MSEPIPKSLTVELARSIAMGWIRTDAERGVGWTGLHERSYVKLFGKNTEWGKQRIASLKKERDHIRSLRRPRKWQVEHLPSIIQQLIEITVPRAAS